MEKPNRLLALLMYLLPVIGPVAVIVWWRKDPLVLYHAYQSLALAAGAVAAPLAWAIGAWVVGWIPWAGSLLAAIAFSLVIAAYIGIIVGWIAGMLLALRGELRPVPMFGAWGERFLQ